MTSASDSPNPASPSSAGCPEKNTSGTSQPELPLLSPVPELAVDTVNVTFDMEVKESEASCVRGEDLFPEIPVAPTKEPERPEPVYPAEHPHL